MSKADDGGPAFPHVMCQEHGGGSWTTKPGLSLRDYFAAAALTGYLAWSPPSGGQTEPARAAEKAYLYADAMLAARAAEAKS